MKRERKKILIRIAVMAPMLIALALVVKPMTAKAWRWYKPWTWPFWEETYCVFADLVSDPTDGCPIDNELMARVMVDGEEGAKDFYTQTAIGWNYAVARALEGKKVHVKLESNWNARTGWQRTQYCSPVEGGHGSDREWLILHQYDMGADMKYKDIPYLNSSSTRYVDAFKDGAIYVPENCDITVDMNGHCIWRRAESAYIDDGEVFHVAEGATLTLVDSDPDKAWNDRDYKGGVIQGGSSNTGGGGLEIKEGATVYIEGVTFRENSSASDGGAIKIDGKKAKLFVNGTTFTENHAGNATFERNYGGAISIDDSTAEIRNTTFTKNWAENRGGAVYMDYGVLTLSNCIFDSNHANGDGGALYMYNYSGNPRTLIEDCTFDKNYSDSSGGALYLRTASGTIDAVRTDIKNNSGFNRGGGVYISGNGVMFYDSEITGNTTVNGGGGIYVDNPYILNLAGKVIIRENKLNNGKTSNVCLTDGSFSTAYLNNGGLTEGSKIGVHSSEKNPGKDGVMLVSNISEFAAKRYFVADSNKLEFTVTHTETGSYLASLIGGNTVALILLGTVSGILLAFTVILYIRRRREAADEKE